MTLRVGDRVRLKVTFQNAERRPMDPREVVATVMDGVAIKNYTMRSGIVRLQLGVFALEHLIQYPGQLGVRFRSVAAGEEASQIASFPVAATNVGEPPPPPHLDKEESEREVAQEMESMLAAQRRSFMVQDLAARGVIIEPDRSDAYVESQHRILCSDRGGGRESYLRRQRGD